MDVPGPRCSRCGSLFIGKIGSRMCSNLICGSYEVNDDNYDLKRSEREDLKETKKLLQNTKETK